MELITSKDNQLCKKCNNLRDKKHGFYKKSKICNNCKLNIKNNIENQAICIICLWTGLNNDYKDHICIGNINNNIKVKYVNNLDLKPNPFLINFNN